MGGYLSDFNEKPAYKEIEVFMPSGICPFLFYNLTSYIFTLANGGWFGWIKRYKDSTYRKTINEYDLKKKDVNRLYANEVLIRCPNPHRTVVAGVGLWPDNKIKIRIMHNSGLCPNNHKSWDEILIDKNEFKTKALKFNTSFPAILIQNLTGRLLNEAVDNCEKGIGVTVEVSKIVFPCRYHKREKGFKANSFVPDGFCPHIFEIIYPHILAVMYNAQVDKKLKVKHPGKDGHITLTLVKVYKIKSGPTRLILSLLKKLFETLFYPVDLLDYKIEITIIENESTNCSLKKGKKYIVNMRDENFLCPASFHALYPYLMLAAYSYKMGWNGHNTVNLLPCPDCVGTVYSIKGRQSLEP